MGYAAHTGYDKHNIPCQQVYVGSLKARKMKHENKIINETKKTRQHRGIGATGNTTRTNEKCNYA